MLGAAYLLPRRCRRRAGVQVRLKALPIFFMVLCVCTYTYVRLGTCSSYILSWLGYLPMQVVSWTDAGAGRSMQRRRAKGRAAAAAGLPAGRQAGKAVPAAPGMHSTIIHPQSCGLVSGRGSLAGAQPPHQWSSG